MESREHLSLSDIRAVHQGFPLLPAIRPIWWTVKPASEDLPCMS